jgi:hypothetical protein
MTAREFKGLSEINLDGRVYVDKLELLKLIKDEKKRHRESKEKGYLHSDRAEALAAEFSLNHLAVLVNKQYYEEVHRRIGSKVIVVLGKESFLYFEGFRTHVAGREGKQTPVFTEDPKLAMLMQDDEECETVERDINAEYPNMKLNHCCANFPWQEGMLRNMHAMYGWPKEKEPDDVLEDELFWVKTLG